MNDFAKQVREQCDGIAEMLVEKNLARGSEYVGDDTVLDLIGYLILYRLATAPAPDARPDVRVVAARGGMGESGSIPPLDSPIPLSPPPGKGRSVVLSDLGMTLSPEQVAQAKAELAASLDEVKRWGEERAKLRAERDEVRVKLDELNSDLMALIKHGSQASLQTVSTRAIREALHDARVNQQRLTAEIEALKAERDERVRSHLSADQIDGHSKQRSEAEEKLRVTMLELKAEKMANDYNREQLAQCQTKLERLRVLTFWLDELARHDTLSLDSDEL